MKWLDAHRAILFPLGVVLVLRIWFALWGGWVITTNSTPIVPNPPTMYHGLARVPDKGWGLLLAPWQRWDAIWYLRIAEFGYAPDDPSTSFFPLFSILTRLAALLTQDYLAASLIVSTLSIAAAFVLIYRITLDIFDKPTAQRAVLYWAVFPTAFFFFAPYAESLLAASALAAIYFARQKRWGAAAIAAGAAALARPVGFLIALPFLVEAWREKNFRALIPITGVALALGAFMLYLQVQFHDALLWVHSEDSWQRVFVFPGTTIVWAAQDILSGHGAVANDLVDLALTLVTLGATLAAWKKLPLSYSLYSLAMIGVPLLSYAQAASYAPAAMAAAGRRALVALPAFIALAATWRGKWKEPLWIGLSATAQIVLFSVFVKWLWVD